MKFQIQQTINAPADHVWEIVGTNFNDISQWASPVLTSKANPELGSDEMGRVCELAGGRQLVETINHYDDDNRQFRFTIGNESTPFFIKGVENTWSVKPNGANQSTVQINADIELMSFFNLFSAPLKSGFRKGGERILQDLKAYAEAQPVAA